VSRAGALGGLSVVLLAIGACGNERAPAASLDPKPTSGKGGTSSTGGSSNAGSAGVAGQAGDAQCTAEVPNGLCLVSQKGDLVGAGKTVSVAGASAAFRIAGSGFISLTVQDPDSGAYELTFEPPASQYFVPGSYKRATLYGSNAVGSAGLEIKADNRGCSALMGAFTVSELGWDPVGNVEHFAATFEQHCERATAPGLFGAINFHAHGEPETPPVDPGDCAVKAPIGFCFASQLGHAEGKGRFVTLDDRLANIALELRHGGRIDASVETDDLSWRVGFAGPHGAPLQVGHYANAGSLSQASPLLANAFCPGLQGSFDVLAIDSGTDTSGAGGAPIVDGAGGAAGASDAVGSLARFDVDFRYTCSNSLSELRGKLRYTRP
jgi:hypothetical protein